MKTDYIQALKAGHEIVIVSADENSDSAIFFMNGSGKLFSFNRSIGCIERTDRTLAEIQEHFENMEHENAHIFIRGWRD